MKFYIFFPDTLLTSPAGANFVRPQAPTPPLRARPAICNSILLRIDPQGTLFPSICHSEHSEESYFFYASSKFRLRRVTFLCSKKSPKKLHSADFLHISCALSVGAPSCGRFGGATFANGRTSHTKRLILRTMAVQMCIREVLLSGCALLQRKYPAMRNTGVVP